MANDVATPDPAGIRGEPLRRQVIDAAERLLREGKPDFSMRDLAKAAGVSFATPFNQFGSKRAIMQALSARRIDTMVARFEAGPPGGDAMARVRRAVETAAAVMLEEPEISRAVMGWVGAPGGAPGQVRDHSTALWALALGRGEGLDRAGRAQALALLPGRLAFAFRGVLSFWTAGEIGNAMLAPCACDMALALVSPWRAD